MIAGRKHRIEPHGCVKILLGSSQIPEIIFGYPSEEVCPVVCRVKSGKDVEILYGQRIFAVSKSLSAVEQENILVILGHSHEFPEGKHDRKSHRQFYNNPHQLRQKFLFTPYFS